MLRKIYRKVDQVFQLLSAIFKRLEEGGRCNDDELLTVNEAASLFKVTGRTVRRWQADGIIKPMYIGGTVHFSKLELQISAKANKLNKK